MHKIETNVLNKDSLTPTKEREREFVGCVWGLRVQQLKMFCVTKLGRSFNYLYTINSDKQ